MTSPYNMIIGGQITAKASSALPIITTPINIINNLINIRMS